jgi:hypothetical protein
LKAIAIYSSLQKIRGREKTTSFKKPIANRKGLSFIDQEIISLPEYERIIFVLKVIENYKKEEISDLLSMTKEEVEGFLNKARETIMGDLVIKSTEALERALNQIPETIEPLENLYDRIIIEISKVNSQENKEVPESGKKTVNKNKKTKEERKHFSLKDLFKKKE